MSKTKYIFVTDRGDYIAVDSASGGYPYETDSIFQAHPFHALYEAERYYAVMSACIPEDDLHSYSRVRTWKLMEVGDVVLSEVSFDKTLRQVV